MVFPTKGVIFHSLGLSPETLWELCGTGQCLDLPGRLWDAPRRRERRGRAGPYGRCAGSPGEPTAELGSRP